MNNKQESRKRVLISGGGYGWGNVGDESILQGIVQNVRTVAPRADITSLTWDPETTARRLGVRAVKVTVTNVLSELYRTDIVLCGGGSTLAEYYDRSSHLFDQVKGYPGHALSVITLGRLLRKKVMVYAPGVEPIRTWWFRQWIRWGLPLADVITVRDERSKSLLESMNVPRERINTVADPAYSLQLPDYPEADKLLEEFKIRELPRPRVAICFAYEPRFMSNLKPQMDFIVRVGLDLIHDNDAHLVFIPMNTQPDLDGYALKTMAADLPENRVTQLSGNYSPDQVLRVVSELDLVVSSRMHLLIFSTLNLKPFIAINRGPKIDSFLEMFDSDSAIDPGNLDGERFKFLANRALEDPEGFRQRISDNLRVIKEIVGKTNTLLSDLVYLP